MKRKNNKLIQTLIIIFVCVGAVFCLVFFLKKDDGQNPPNNNVVEEVYLSQDLYINNEQDLSITTKSYKIQTEPEVMDTLYENYPNFLSSQSFTDEQKTEIMTENKSIMDNLIETIYNGELKKHPLADYQYNNSELIDYTVHRVDKKVTINPIMRGWRAIGYAMPGEVVTIKFPEGFNKYNQISLNIGMSGGNGGEDQNFANKNFFNNKRMPYLTKTISGTTIAEKVIENEFKIGSPFGGMIYLRTWDSLVNSLPFEVEVIGGVDAPIYVLGETTDAEWENLRQSPGLMAEIRMSGLRMVMTANYVRAVKNMREVAEFWHKAISLSEYGVVNQSRNLPITIMFDYRVDAGAAVAYVGAWYCQCPTGWASGVVNYESMMASGNWGTLHEMNHHMQGTYNNGGRWGISGGNEVTNNVMTAMTYILYTNIASSRTENGGLDGWNYVTDGYNTMKTVYGGSNDSKLLRSYIGLAHGFGVDKFLEFSRSYYTTWFNENYATIYNIFRDSTSAFCLLASKIFKHDMRYYCSLFNYTVTEEVASAVQEMNLPTYYPIFNVYTMGYNGIETGRPFTITGNQPFTFDFGKYMAIETGLSYSLEITGFKNGHLEKLTDTKYIYTPNLNVKNDKFVLKITLNNESVISLNGEINMNYNFANVKKYNNITKSGMDEAVEKSKSLGPVLSTTKILGLGNYNDGTTKTLSVIEGKFFFDKGGYYTFFLKADDKGKFIVHLDSGDLKIAETTTYNANYQKNNANTYKTIYIEKDKFYNFTLYNLNTGGQGNINIGYIYNGETELTDFLPYSITNIGKKNITSKDITDLNLLKEEKYISKEIQFTRPLKNIAKTYKTINSTDIIALSVPKKANDGGGVERMFDNNNSTYYHTSYPGNGGATTFPAEFVFENLNKKSFNYFNIYQRRQIDAVGDYEIYLGEELENLTLVKSGRNTNVNFNVKFDKTYDSKYIKIKALNNTANNQYLVFAEVTFGLNSNFENYTKLNSNNANIKNMDVIIDANSINLNKLEGSGQISFNFKGKELGIYSQKNIEYGKFEICIDNKFIQIIDLSNQTLARQQLVFATHLTEAEHTVTLKSVEENNFNIEMIAFK